MGFQFAKKRQIDICGKQYECDSTNNNLILGVKNGWPNVVRSVQHLMNLRNDEPKSASADQRTEEIVAATEDVLKACRTFIVGTLGEAEYQEIFEGRKPNSVEHIDLCSYIFAFITQGRSEYLDDFRAAVEEEWKDHATDNTAKQNSGQTGADVLPVVDEKRRPGAGFFSAFRRKD